jgi:hypothetical protein
MKWAMILVLAFFNVMAAISCSAPSNPPPASQAPATQIAKSPTAGTSDKEIASPSSVGASQAVSRSESKTSATPGAAAAEASIDPCTLLTVAEVEGVIGKLGQEPSKRDQPMGKVAMLRQCQYFGEGEKPEYLTLQAIQRHPEDKGSYSQDNMFKSQKLGYEEVESKTQDVSGLGEDAFWVDSKEIGEDLSHSVLIWRAKEVVLVMFIPGNGQETLEKAKKLAISVVGRL